MKKIQLNKNQFEKLVKYEIHEEIKNNESYIYLYNHNELLKIFKDNDKNFLLNKLYVLNKLFYIKENLKFDELVLPNKLIELDNNPAGYSMDFIKYNTNIGRILSNNNISFEDKKFILKQISKILRKIELDKTLQELSFHLGDIHEYNFIYDNKYNTIRAIDLDSAYVKGVEAPHSMFLTMNDKLWDFPNKYPLDQNNRHISNNNTTILCFIYMYLNTLTNEYVPDLSIGKFCEILNMLNSIGVNKKILDSFFNIYLPNDNYLDYELLDSITESQYNKFKELQLKNVKK